MSDRLAPEEHSIPLHRRLAYSAVLALLIVAVTEGAARGLFYLRYGGPLPERERLHEYDPELGWRNRPRHRVPDRYGPGKHATHNAQGLRAAADYTARVPEGKYRIVCLGDSFMYGIVGDEETIPAWMEALCPRVEAVNMGGAGYGIDQAYLWYRRDGARLQAQLLLFALIEDDFRRMGMSAFMTDNPKPQLAVDGGQLVATNVPVPTWGAAAGRGWFEEFPNKMAIVQLARKVHNTYLERYDVLSGAGRALDALAHNCRSRGHGFALAYLPTRVDLASSTPTREASWLKGYARERGLALVDLTASIRDLSVAERARHFQADGHYSAEGNRRTAALLLDALREHYPELPVAAPEE